MDRALVALVVMACGLALGASLGLVQPASRSLTSARDRESTLEARVEDAEALSARRAALEARLKALETRAAEVRGRSALALEPDGAYGVVTKLASRAGVRVEQFNPVASPPQTASGRGAPVAAQPRSLRCSMVVIGEYAGLARFLRLMGEETGYMGVERLTITPLSEGASAVSARVETVHYGFDPAPTAAERGPVGGGG